MYGCVVTVDLTPSSSREIREFQEEMDFQEHLETTEVLDLRENLVEEEMGQRETEENQDYQVCLFNKDSNEDQCNGYTLLERLFVVLC